MLAWSDNPIHGGFRIRFFIDTNILVYLVDNTFSSLSDFISYISENPFVELVSSKFVIFEYVGVRKKEYFLRIAADRINKLPNGKINFSSLIKYKDEYSTPNLPFDVIQEDIKKEVNGELNQILANFKINYEYSQFHEEQLSPTFDVCLSSKLSNQDSLVLVSSVYPSSNKTNDDVVLLTNDGSFASSTSSNTIKDTLTQHKISAPKVYQINNIEIQNEGSLNLQEIIDPSELRSKTIKKILELIINKQESLFMGKTFTPSGERFPKNIVAFKLEKRFIVKKNIYISIIGKDLDFIYTSRNKISSLYHNGTPLTDGFIAPDDKKINVSFKITETNIDGTEKDVESQIMQTFRTEGHYVFIHPDSV